MVMTLSSVNRKTGDMVQTFILRADMHPVEAIATGSDVSICGQCPLRGDGTGKNRPCYVDVGNAPAAVWRKYVRGGYAHATRASLTRALRGRRVRFGAYGDPGLVPLDVLHTLARLSDGWTGYTHQWRNIDPGYAHYVMASGESVGDRKAAHALGYRTFQVIGKGAARPERAVQCLNVARGTACIDCMACGGTREGAVTGAVDIWIEAHGNRAKNIVTA
jgi:hypothetical protein